MALPDSAKLTVGTSIIFGNVAAHAPGATSSNNLGAITTEMTLTSVADAAARQGVKFDFLANRAPLWTIDAALEFAATPTAGLTVEFWLAPSNSATAGQANPGGIAGTDAAYAGYSANLTAAIKQLQLIGIFICTAQATGTIQVMMNCGTFTPPNRYGTLVVYNKSGIALHSDMVEMSVALRPIEHQLQD